MSDRQARNRRKMYRRQRKLIDEGNTLEHPEFVIKAASLDYGTVFALAFERHSDGLRMGTYARAERLWRRMDDVPARMVAKLLAWFDERPPSVSD